MTKCFGLDAVQEARKRVPIILKVEDLAGLFPLVGIGLGSASLVLMLEIFLHRTAVKQQLWEFFVV